MARPRVRQRRRARVLCRRAPRPTSHSSTATGSRRVRSAARPACSATARRSASPAAGGFSARDLLRPPLVETDDMKGDRSPDVDYLDGITSARPADVAADSDNNWTDGAVNRRACLRRLHLRLLLQAVRAARPRQQQHPHPQPGASGSPTQDVAHYFNQFPDFFIERVLRGRRRRCLRRRPAARVHASAGSLELPGRRDRHRRARADARRDRVTRPT